MSDPPNTSSIVPHHHHHQTPPSPSLPSHPSTSGPTTSLAREYRKGNWTLHETLVLITAKKLDDERRTKGPTTDPTKPSSCKTAELRWKWVENYCWNNGCLRSQNQCNDKWDNLLRDYKKVRDYEARSDDQDHPSYWRMEKHERKDRNLPSNLLFDVFQALYDVVNRKQQPPKMLTTPSLGVAPPPPLPLPPPPPPAPPSVGSSESTEGSESGHDSGSKRRKVRNIGSSIVKGATVLARTLMACEEKKEKRHRDLMELEERRVQMEEDRTEVNRQGIAGLITAVNNLSNAVHALVSDRHDTR
ncbi:uncharacterized protein LOC143864351 [Tasmannia lanceolata]|uniref:uncharacterized protein LOC143864351 n=1 Tax=Tasmannia lanceolata TaxID=3420 RepID=UPI004064598E